MSSIYIAARFGRREEALDLAKDLRSLGLEVIATWFNQGQAVQVNYPSFSEEARRNNEDIAFKDWDEITRSDIFITLTEDMDNLPEGAARGGRHCEFGIALALENQIIIIGPREHIFHWIPDVTVYNSTEEFLHDLRNGTRVI